jgi:hypothetical protein
MMHNATFAIKNERQLIRSILRRMTCISIVTKDLLTRNECGKRPKVKTQDKRILEKKMDTEKALLSALSNADSISTYAFANASGTNHESVIGVAKSLSADGFVTMVRLRRVNTHTPLPGRTGVLCSQFMAN